VYRTVIDRLLPTVLKLQKQGKFRFLGITESSSKDYSHEMLPIALADDAFDTIMVGYNLMNQTPEHYLLPMAQQKNVGVICMVAVRYLLRWTEYMRKKIANPGTRSVNVRYALNKYDPMGLLMKKEEIPSLTAVGYKYVAAHPAIATVLTGTTNIEHLEHNARSILDPHIHEHEMTRLRRIFSNILGLRPDDVPNA